MIVMTDFEADLDRGYMEKLGLHLKPKPPQIIVQFNLDELVSYLTMVHITSDTNTGCAVLTSKCKFIGIILGTVYDIHTNVPVDFNPYP